MIRLGEFSCFNDVFNEIRLNSLKWLDVYMADHYTLKEDLTKIIQKSQYFFKHFSKIWGYFTLSTYLICKWISKTFFLQLFYFPTVHGSFIFVIRLCIIIYFYPKFCSINDITCFDFPSDNMLFVKDLVI